MKRKKIKQTSLYNDFFYKTATPASKKAVAKAVVGHKPKKAKTTKALSLKELSIIFVKEYFEKNKNEK